MLLSFVASCPCAVGELRWIVDACERSMSLLSARVIVCCCARRGVSCCIGMDPTPHWTALWLRCYVRHVPDIWKYGIPIIAWRLVRGLGDNHAGAVWENRLPSSHNARSEPSPPEMLFWQQLHLSSLPRPWSSEPYRTRARHPLHALANDGCRPRTLSSRLAWAPPDRPP